MHPAHATPPRPAQSDQQAGQQQPATTTQAHRDQGGRVGGYNLFGGGVLEDGIVVVPLSYFRGVFHRRLRYEEG